MESLPTVCIANAVDTLRRTISLAPTPEAADRILRVNFPQQDQSVLWRPFDKLIVSERPVEGFAWITSLLGVRGAANVHPAAPSGCLFRDVVSDRALQTAIVDWAGEGRAFELIVHTTTPGLWEMVEFLRKELDLTVLLPESSTDQGLRDLLDTKAGFRDFAARLGFSTGIARIARGAHCTTRFEAAAAIIAMLSNGVPAIAKPDRGEASVGLNIFHPGARREDIDAVLSANSFFGADPIVVEEYWQGDGLVFPSVEFFVPAGKQRLPFLTYACSMLFDRPTDLCGNFIYPELGRTAWFSPLRDAGLQIARAMQEAGYVGHFDIDAVSRADGQSLMLDLNPRRTGATHVHEFAAGFLGNGYQRSHAVGAVDIYGRRAVTLEQLIEALGNCIRSPLTSTAGVLPCEITGLCQGRVSLLVWGPSSESVRFLRQSALGRLTPLGFEADRPDVG